MADGFITLVSIQPSGSTQAETFTEAGGSTMKQGLFAHRRQNQTGAPTLSPGAPLLPGRLLALTAGSLAISSAWSTVAGAVSFNLYWSTTPGVTLSSNKITGVSSPYAHTGRTAGQRVYYAQTVVTEAGEGPLGAEVSEVAQALPPSETVAMLSPVIDYPLRGFPHSTVSLSLAFYGVDPRATSYNVYWSLTPGVTSGSTKVAGISGSPFVHEGLLAETPYYYRVSCTGPSGESGLSPEMNGTTGRPFDVVDANTYLMWLNESSAGSVLTDTVRSWTIALSGGSLRANSGMSGRLRAGNSLQTFAGNYYHAVSNLGATNSGLLNAVFAGEFTFDLWLAAGNYPGYPGIVNWTPTGTPVVGYGDATVLANKWFYIGFNRDDLANLKLYYQWRDSTGATITGYFADHFNADSLENGGFHLYTVRRKSMGAGKYQTDCFVDGALSSSSGLENAINGNSTNCVFDMGGYTPQGYIFFTGMYDIIRISNRARSDGEIADYFIAG